MWLETNRTGPGGPIGQEVRTKLSQHAFSYQNEDFQKNLLLLTTKESNFVFCHIITLTMPGTP